MKTALSQVAALCVFFATTFFAYSQGFIVPNGVVTNLFAGEIDLNWPQETQINGFSLNPAGKQQPTSFTNVFSFIEPATIGVRVFLVASNDPVSLQAIQLQNYTELLYPNDYVFAAGVPFYVGLYSGANVAPPYPPTLPYNYLDPVFGWAELENVGGTVELLNSALEYQGGGIFAGTENIILAPEPTTLSLVILGTAGMFALRWGFKRSSRPDSVREAA